MKLNFIYILCGYRIGHDQVKFVLTAEIQGCSIFSRIDKLTNTLELYHYNRSPEVDIAVFPGGKYYDKTDEIIELRGVSQLLNSRGRPLPTVNGTVKIPSDGIFYMKNGIRNQLNTIGRKTVNAIIADNEVIRKRLNVLENRYNKGFHWETHLPYIDLTNPKVQIFATVLMYIDHSMMNWKFASQQIKYTDVYKDKNKFEIIPNEDITVLNMTPRDYAVPKTTPRSVVSSIKRPEPAYIPNRNRREIGGRDQLSEYLTFGGNNNETFLQVSSEQPKHEGNFETGVQWMNKIDTNGSMLLLFTLLKQLKNSTSFDENERNYETIAMSVVECEIFASKIVQNFYQTLTNTAIKCGIPTVIRQILSETNFNEIAKKVFQRCRKMETEKVPQVLIDMIVDKNKSKIIARSSSKQFAKLRDLIMTHKSELSHYLAEKEDSQMNCIINSRSKLT